ncbi:MAG: hypothetical protein K2N63_12400 [Lachnospiraceae bacterium]|nr:hypothetical protein [Lachnospiraceae bacterium]
MKKNSIRWWVALAAVLAVYNVIVFAVPFPKNAVFFLSWVFTMIAIIAQVYVIRTAFYQGEGAKSKFYGFPIAKIGVTYLACQIALKLVFMVIGFVAAVPIWIPLVLYVVLLGASAVGFVAVDAVRDEVERQDVTLKKDVSCMRSLQSKTVTMVQLAQDSQVRKALEQFAEALRFSDPVSSGALEDIERDLTACVDELQMAVADNSYTAILVLIQKAETVLAERNRLCKLNK